MEARTVQVPALALVVQFTVSQLALLDEVASASACPDDGVRWSLDVRKKCYDELLCTLGAKLAAAVGKATIAELGRHIDLKKKQATIHGKFLKGRLIFSLLYEHDRVSETDGTILEFRDFLNAETPLSVSRGAPAWRSHRTPIVRMCAATCVSVAVCGSRVHLLCADGIRAILRTRAGVAPEPLLALMGLPC